MRRMVATVTAAFVTGGLLFVGASTPASAIVVVDQTSTFSINGTYGTPDPDITGDVVFDITTNRITSADITLTSPSLTFTNILGTSGPSGSNYDLNLEDTTNNYYLDLVIVSDSSLESGLPSTIGSGTELLNLAGALIGSGFQGTVDPTPLPAALPLFASGLGVVGLLARRRKRKAQAA